MNFTLSFGAPLNVDYLTRLDWLFFSCYILQILVVGHSFIMYLIAGRISAEIAALDKRKRRRMKMDPQALEWHQSANVLEKNQFKPFDLKLAKRAEKEHLIYLRKVDVLVMIALVSLGRPSLLWWI